MNSKDKPSIVHYIPVSFTRCDRCRCKAKYQVVYRRRVDYLCLKCKKAQVGK